MSRTITKAAIYVLGAIQLLVGLWCIVFAESILHQLFGTAGIGFGSVTLGIGAILTRMDEHAAMSKLSAPQ
ncbi:hypothetical protein AB4Y96_09310 [Phyllobacterium sp. TAF24]|uniref:hypothetical protein n=1 Tax=Phyllobacterium sp. TAF24 TaxID=3233068 RepID=UPI003F9647DC